MVRDFAVQLLLAQSVNCFCCAIEAAVGGASGSWWEIDRGKARGGNCTFFRHCEGCGRSF